MKSVSVPSRLAVPAAGLLLAFAGVFLVSFSAPTPSRAQQVSAGTVADPPPAVFITLDVKGATLPELLAKLFEQAKPAGVSYRLAADLAPIKTPFTVDLHESALNEALTHVLNMVEPPLTYTRTGDVYVIGAAPLYSVEALNRADVRQALDHLLTQAGERFVLDQDVQGVITLPPARHTLISALNEITGNAVPRLRWTKKSDVYAVSLAPKQLRPATLPRVSVDASGKRVGSVLEQALEQAHARYEIHLDIEQNEPVTVRLRNTPLDKALTRICAQVSPALTWSWDEYTGAFVITSTRVSVSAVNEPVANVLSRIVSQAGCGYNGSGFDPAVNNKRITVDFRNEPLDRALDQVCAQASPPLTWFWNGPGTTITVRPRQ